MGAEITIVTSAPKTQIDTDRVFFYKGIRIIVYPYYFPQSIFGSLIPEALQVSLNIIYYLPKIHKKYNFDILHSHSGAPLYSLPSIVLKKILKIPAIHTLHGLTSSRIGKNTSTNKILTKLDRVIITTSVQYENFKDLLPEANIIPSGLYINDFFPLKKQEKKKIYEKLNMDFNIINIGFIGPLSERKGFHNFLKISKELIKEFPNIKFIVMNSNSENSIKKKIKGLEDHYIFTGYVERRNEIINCMDIVVFPFDYINLTVGQPIALLESMLCGKSIVVTDVEGIREIITHGINGLICPRYDLENIKKQIIYLMNNDTKRNELGKSAMLRAKDYDIKTIAKQILTIYTEILSKDGNIMEKHYSETLYSEIAEDYDETRWEGNGEFIDLLQKELLYRILNKCGVEKNDKILDVGVGTGRLILPFVEKGFDTYGIDISEKMLEIIWNKIGFLSNLHLEKANAKNLPFQDNFFDFVTSYRVVIHIPDYENVIKEVFRVLKPNGYAIIEFNNKYSLSGLGRLLRHLRRIVGMPEETNTQIVSRSVLIKSFSEAGFEIEKIYPQFFISEIMYKLLPSQTLKFLGKADLFLCNSFLGRFATRFIVLSRKR